MRTAGLTDVEIAVDIGRHLSGAPRGDEVGRLIRRYEELLPERIRVGAGAVLSGAREILEDLAGRPDVTSVLSTGNTEAGARVKLRHYGLGPYLAAGAFADETTDRIAIARKGWELVTRLLGTPPARDRSLVIGDPPPTTSGALGPSACAPWPCRRAPIQRPSSEPTSHGGSSSSCRRPASSRRGSGCWGPPRWTPGRRRIRLEGACDGALRI